MINPAAPRDLARSGPNRRESVVRVGENERGSDKSSMGKKVARRLEMVGCRQTGGGEETGDVSGGGGGVAERESFEWAAAECDGRGR